MIKFCFKAAPIRVSPMTMISLLHSWANKLRLSSGLYVLTVTLARFPHVFECRFRNIGHISKLKRQSTFQSSHEEKAKIVENEGRQGEDICTCQGFA
jgi:hypothetical protein